MDTEFQELENYYMVYNHRNVWIISFDNQFGWTWAKYTFESHGRAI